MCVIGSELQNAAWYYTQPKEKAENIRDHVAFCELTICYQGQCCSASPGSVLTLRS